MTEFDLQAMRWNRFGLDDRAKLYIFCNLSVALTTCSVSAMLLRDLPTIDG